MLFFFESGQLGNQLFQYNFLDELRNKNERVVLFGFNELKDTFDDIEATILKRNRITNFFYFFCFKNIFEFLVKKNIISVVRQKKETILGESCRVNGYYRKKGILRKITYVDEGYFQNGEIESKYLKIKKIFVDKAYDELKQYKKDYKIFFIHIRRGDYLDFVVYNHKGVELPIEYYKELIKEIELKYINAFFVFLTNDVKYVEKEFNDVMNKYISRNDFQVDFALMTLSDGGILSCSTFSWWGAFYLLKDKESYDIYGPKYWMGFKSKSWYPKGIKSKFIKYIEIEKE